MVIYCDSFESPVGIIYIAFNSNGIVRITLEKERFGREYSSCEKKENRKARVQFREYFDGKRKRFSLSLHFEGTPFQKKVWNALKKIPYGETRSYEWVAKEAGRPKAVRAAGNAVGANPLPIVIPCHRVIRKDGELGGYGYGISIKKKLLEIEQ
ncbi:MAG: methylated-DNA--[protein]-cysteine S-methyltransferase [Nitrospiraceae bacterium]|nr:methylated-DNA--[protein]-cysteine S-methyltransferase [Nitrospiraceae bacterium]